MDPMFKVWFKNKDNLAIVHGVREDNILYHANVRYRYLNPVGYSSMLDKEAEELKSKYDVLERAKIGEISWLLLAKKELTA